MFWNTKVTEWTSISVIQCQQTKLVSAWYFWTKWHQLLYLGSCNYNLSVNIILRKWIPSMYQRNNKIRIATQHFAFVWQMVTVLWGRTSTKKRRNVLQNMQEKLTALLKVATAASTSSSEEKVTKPYPLDFDVPGMWETVALRIWPFSEKKFLRTSVVTVFARLPT